MRATISFETDVGEVEGTMAVLAGAEEHNLRAAADILSNFTVLDGSPLGAITEALRLIDMSTTQLRQYRDMLVNFERAKFETIVPRSADGVLDGVISSVASMKEDIKKLKDFDNFVDKMNEGATKNEESANDSEKR